MLKTENKVYDLGERTFQFAKRAALYCKELPKDTVNFKYIDQVVRASGSVEIGRIMNKKLAGDVLMNPRRGCVDESPQGMC